jgi:hypothetical protein
MVLEGIVVDDSKAKFEGKWSKSGGLFPQVGGGYHYAAANSGAEARYEFQIPKAGKYRVVLYWAVDDKRACNAPCTLVRDGKPPVTIRLNQRESSPTGSHPIGEFEFSEGTHAIVLKTDKADGTVHADAVQILPVP